mmetsp:Transcript_3713/g.10985  ORF Transcript_3713/g.10985 Transcript_3713/m.10985 type:complete len:510 (+) Transcript_3713:205-1734(+)
MAAPAPAPGAAPAPAESPAPAVPLGSPARGPFEGDARPLDEMLDQMEVDGILRDDDGDELIEDDGDDLGEDMPSDDDDESTRPPTGAASTRASTPGQERPFRKAIESDDSVKKLEGHVDAVYCVATSIKGDVMTGGGDDRAWLYRGALLADGEPAPPPVCLEGHADSVTACGFSHAAAFAATGGYDGTVRLWDVATGALARTLEGPGDVEWLDWHPKGDVILAGACDGTIWMWLATSGACMRVFAGHDGAVLCGGFTSDGKRIVTGSADGSVRVWAPKKGACGHCFAPHPGGPPPAKATVMTQGAVACLAFHPTEPDLVLAGAEDGCAVVLHCKAKKIIARLEHAATSDADDAEPAASVVAVGFAANPDRWAATGAVDGGLKIWEFRADEPRCRAELAHGAAVVALEWHPRQPTVVSASADLKVRVWDARSGAAVAEYAGATDVPLCMTCAFAPAGGPSDGFVVTGGDDKVARVFSLPGPGAPPPPPPAEGRPGSRAVVESEATGLGLS